MALRPRHSTGANPTPRFTGGRDPTHRTSSVGVDWKETAAAHVFEADVPGLKKEDVKVHIKEGRVLRISGEKSDKTVEVTDTWHVVERSSGRFERTFRLPQNANADRVEAAMNDGVLTVTVPKVEPLRSIQISG